MRKITRHLWFADKAEEAARFYVSLLPDSRIERLWAAFSNGGQAEQCGWLMDRYGLCWQIVPTRLDDLLTDPDSAKAARVAKAIFGMTKFEIAALERAAEG